jgi:hypothetical protein
MNLTGRYRSGDRIVNLRGSTVKKQVVNIRPLPPPNNPASPEEGYQPNAEYYYSNTEIEMGYAFAAHHVYNMTLALVSTVGFRDRVGSH